MNEPRRIACFHLNQLGDLLFSLPALYSLRTGFPKAHITSVARPQLSELLKLAGLVDEIVERPRRPFGSGFRVAAELRRERPDLGVLFSTSLGMAALALLSGCRERVGFAHWVAKPFLTRRVPWAEPPSTQNNLRLLEAIGCPAAKTDYVGLIEPGQPENEEACQILQSAGIGADERFAALGPGTSGGREVKSWTDEGFAEVADRLATEFGLRSVVVGLGRGEQICRLSRNAVDLTEKTSLPVLAGVLRRAGLFIGVDSGVMHLAASVGTPVVALFGPSDPEVTGPQGEGHRVVCAAVSCRPCPAKSCEIGRRCMTEITPDMVIQAVSSLPRRGSA